MPLLSVKVKSIVGITFARNFHEIGTVFELRESVVVCSPLKVEETVFNHPIVVVFH